MNRRNFLKLLGKGVALLAAIPFVGIPEPEASKAERLGKAIADGVAGGIEPQETDYLSGTIAIDEGWSDQIVDWDGSAWEQIPT